jgi:hypothetical protein
MDDQFNTIEIAALAHDLVSEVAKRPHDITVKIAALRAAAEVLQQAVASATVAAMVANALRP